MGASLDSEGYYYSVGSYLDGGMYGEYAESNALKLASELYYNYQWTEQAICAWYGAIAYESQFNPAQIEGNLTAPTTNSGVGYIQWTPSSQLISYCNSWGVRWQLTSSQLRKWELERTTNDSDIKQWFLISQYLNLYRTTFPNSEPLPTMDAFTRVPDDEYTFPELCAQVILFYTRPTSWENTQNFYRNADVATYWYEKLYGKIPKPDSKHKMPLWMLLKYH